MFPIRHPNNGSPKYRNFYEMDEIELFLRNGAFSSPFCNICSVFMISIISDYKNNIKYDFAIFESYFIKNGEDIVPLLM